MKLLNRRFIKSLGFNIPNINKPSLVTLLYLYIFSIIKLLNLYKYINKYIEIFSIFSKSI